MAMCECKGQLVLSDTTCEKCGGQVWTKPKKDGSARKKRFCSYECRVRREQTRAERTARQRRESEERRKRVCTGCGTEYIQKKHATHTDGSKFCSRDCYFSFASKLKQQRAEITASHVSFVRYRKACTECGDHFFADHRILALCGSCKAKRKTSVTHRHCVSCGVEFYPIPRIGPGQKVCSDGCHAKHVLEIRKKGHRVGKGRRRAKAKTNGPYESIDPFVVFERDGWTCAGCGCSTPEDLRGSHEDDAPELDHVVALSSGGSHTYDNVQTLCRVCNILKSDSDNEVFTEWNQGHRKGTPKP